jgi:hypothetical protein
MTVRSTVNRWISDQFSSKNAVLIVDIGPRDLTLAEIHRIVDLHGTFACLS